MTLESHMAKLFHCKVWHGTVHFWGVFHWVQYLVLFLVPPWPRYQANRTVTKSWRVNSADHWLAGENSHCLRHWTCGTRLNRPLDLNQHSQRRIDRNCFEWAHLSLTTKKWLSLSVEEVQMFLSLIAEERIQRELGATWNEKVFQESQQ